MVSAGQMYYEIKDYEMNRIGEIEFTGKLAEEMGLVDKPVTEEIYSNLRDGKDPTTGEQLVKAAPNGEHRSGVDITFTPDKTFSIAYAAGTPEQRETLMDAFKEANSNFVNYIESNLIQTRDQHGNSTPSGNTICMSTTHFTDRENNLNIHTHNSLFNITKDADGNYRAINSDALYRREHLIAVQEKMFADALHTREIATESVKYDTGKSFYTKISGVDPKLCEIESTRSQQITEYINQHKDELKAKYPDASEGKLREVAGLATRSEKEEITIEKVISNFEEKAKEAGIDTSKTWDNIHTTSELQKENYLSQTQMTATETVKTAADILTQSESVFTKQELLTTATRLSLNNPDVSFSDIQSSVTELTTSKEFLHLETVSMKGEGKVEYMTTQEIKEIEANNVKEIREGEGKFEPRMSKDKVQEELSNDKNSHLTPDQKNIVECILTSPDKYSNINGIAGVGKTTAAEVVRELAESKGYQVHGLAPTGTAAEKLSAAIPNSQTISSFILEHSPKETTPGKYGDGYHPSGKNALDQSINKAVFGEHGERSIDNIINTKVFGNEGERDIDHQIDKVVTGEHGERSLDKIIDNKINDAIENAGTKGHIFIVDEFSMIDSRKLNEMTKTINEKYPNSHISFLGDRGQLPAIGAGQPSDYLHKLGAFTSKLEITHTVRFKTDQTKDISKDISNKDIDKVFSALEKSGQLHEIKNRDNLISAITKDYCSRDIKNTVVIASTNADRKDINNAIRDTLKEQGKIEKEGKVYDTREALSLTPADKHFAQNYKVGDSLFASKSATGFKPGQEGTITSIDHKNNTITAEKSNGNEVKIYLTKDGSKFSGYRETQTEFVKGDRALFTKNDDTIGVKNGTTGTVMKAENDYLKVKLDNGKIAAFYTKDYSYLTHANAITNHKMQGATTKESITYLDSKNAQMNNYQAANVALTRAEDKVTVYTDNIEKIKEQIHNEQIKMDTLTMKSEMQELNKFTNEIKDKLGEMKDLLKEINDKNLSVSKDVIGDVKMYATSLEIAKETIEKEGVYRLNDSEQIDKNIKEIHEAVKEIEDRIKDETKDIREIAGEVKDDLKKEFESVKETLNDIKSDISNPDTLKSLSELQNSFNKSADLIEKVEPHLSREDTREINNSVTDINKSIEDIREKHKDYSDMKNELGDLKNTLEVVSEHNINLENKGELMNQCKEQLDRVESYAKTQFENDKNTMSEVSQKVEDIREVVDKIEDKDQEKTEDQTHEKETEHEDQTPDKGHEKHEGKDVDSIDHEGDDIEPGAGHQEPTISYETGNEGDEGRDPLEDSSDHGIEYD